MKKLFFMIIFSLFLYSGLHLFPQSNSLMAQPQSTALLSQELLETYSLPEGPITEGDIPQVKTVIRKVLNKINESIESSGQARDRSDLRPIMSGILIFQDWLTLQGCVKQASNWYVKANGKYNDDIFISYPGQVPFDILFNMNTDEKTQDGLYRLMIFVTKVDLLRFANLAENKTIIVWPGQETLYLVPSDK